MRADQFPMPETSAAAPSAFDLALYGNIVSGAAEPEPELPALPLPPAPADSKPQRRPSESGGRPSPAKRQRKKSTKSAGAGTPSRQALSAPLDRREVQHLVHFFLCQLREQCGRIVGPACKVAFDAEMERLDPALGARDVAAMDTLMGHFFDHKAKGDKVR